MSGNLGGWIIIVLHALSFLLIKKLTRAGLRAIVVTGIAILVSIWIVTITSGWRAFQYALLLVCVDIAFSDLIGRKRPEIKREIQASEKARNEVSD